jgi:hypothetical protein
MTINTLHVPAIPKALILYIQSIISVVNLFLAFLEDGYSTESRDTGMTTMSPPAFYRSIGIVYSHMPFELIGSWESFPTSSEGACEWPFARVCTHQLIL